MQHGHTCTYDLVAATERARILRLAAQPPTPDLDVTAMSHVTHTVLLYGGVALAVWAFCTGVRRLMLLGGPASEEAGQVIYRLRPGVRFLSYAYLLLGIGMLSYVWSNRYDLFLCSVQFLFGLACVYGGAFILSTRMVLDENGLHYFHWPNKQTTITWSSIDHYETMTEHYGISTVYFFRPTEGKSIGVTDTAYDVKDLLSRVQARHPLHEKPYKRRKWYGG